MLLPTATREPDALARWFGSLAASVGIATLVLRLSPLLCEKLGHPFSLAIERLGAMLFIVVSVQMLLDGVGDYL